MSAFISGVANPMTSLKEQKEKFLERQKKKMEEKVSGLANTFITHENVAPNLDYDALARGDIHAVLGDKFNAILQEYGHKPTRQLPTKGTKNK